MSLFKRDDLNKNKPTSSLGVFASKNRIQDTILQSPKTLKKDLGTLQDGFCYDFVTKGNISIIHLITYCLEQIGKADLYFTTWSIGETACRNLIMLKESNLIDNIEAVFSTRVNTNSSAPYTMIKQHCRRYTTADLHAKVYVLAPLPPEGGVNNGLHIVIKGSLNIGDNPKIEAGTITVNTENALFHQQWISEMIDKKDKGLKKLKK